jgi:hypothetical protein
MTTFALKGIYVALVLSQLSTYVISSQPQGDSFLIHAMYWDLESSGYFPWPVHTAALAMFSCWNLPSLPSKNV